MTYTMLTQIAIAVIAIAVVPAGAQAQSAGAQAAAPSADVSPSPAGPPSPHSHLVPLILGGVALALGGDAVAAELSARSTYDRAKREPDDARQASLWHSANTQRYVAEGLGVAGLACAGVAIWRYARGDDREPTASTAQARRWQVAPILGNDRAGFALEGRY